MKTPWLLLILNIFYALLQCFYCFYYKPKVRLLQSKNFDFICFDESPLKMMRNVFNFTLKLSSCLRQKQPPEVFCKKGVIRNLAKFTGKHLCQSLFLNKVAGAACRRLLLLRYFSLFSFPLFFFFFYKKALLVIKASDQNLNFNIIWQSSAWTYCKRKLYKISDC